MNRHVFTFADLRRTFIEYSTPGRKHKPLLVPSSTLARHIKDWRSGQGGEWEGGTAADTRRWIERGYDFPPMPASLSPQSMDARRPKWVVSDEPDGEFDYDLYESGEPDYFRTLTNVGSKPGIRVEVVNIWVCSTNAKVLADYGRWVGSALYALQAQGYDLEIRVTAPSNGVFSGGDDTGFTPAVQVSKFGEQVMARDWSVMFSPTGSRHLMFLALMLPEARKLRELNDKPRRVSGSLGQGMMDSRYDINWQPESRTLLITNQYMTPNDFPAEAMTRKLAAIQKEV